MTNPSAYPGYNALAQEIQARMQSWPAPGEIVFAKDIDPTISDLSPLLSNQLKEFIEPVRYPSLVWKLRNYVIHEGRNPGEGVDLELGDTSPYYHHLTHIDGITRTWELYFLTSFYQIFSLDAPIISVQGCEEMILTRGWLFHTILR